MKTKINFVTDFENFHTIEIFINNESNISNFTSESIINGKFCNNENSKHLLIKSTLGENLEISIEKDEEEEEVNYYLTYFYHKTYYFTLSKRQYMNFIKFLNEIRLKEMLSI